MTDKQQPQERPTDIEDRCAVSSPAAVYKGLYNRMNPNQKSGALPIVIEDGAAADGAPSSRTSSTSSIGCEEPVSRNQSVRSTVTTKYDLDGKGYLDDTEKAMRALDTSNKGTLDMHKVYTIMKELQEQQRELHVQQKNFANLKKVVVALTCFAMVLALANLGTAFAAATLAKETTVDAASGALLAKGTGEAISTVGTGTVLHVEEAQPEDEDESPSARRALRVTRRRGLGRRSGNAVAGLFCPDLEGTVSKGEMNELARNIDRGSDYVTFAYSFKDSESGKKRTSNLFVRLQESDWDPEEETLQMTGTRNFECDEDNKDLCKGYGYYIAPEDFLIAPISKGKYGLYSCISEPSIPVRE